MLTRKEKIDFEAIGCPYLIEIAAKIDFKHFILNIDEKNEINFRSSSIEPIHHQRRNTFGSKERKVTKNTTFSINWSDTNKIFFDSTNLIGAYDSHDHLFSYLSAENRHC